VNEVAGHCQAETDTGYACNFVDFHLFSFEFCCAFLAMSLCVAVAVTIFRIEFAMKNMLTVFIKSATAVSPHLHPPVGRYGSLRTNCFRCENAAE
jgi:hypothetical protein